VLRIYEEDKPPKQPMLGMLALYSVMFVSLGFITGLGANGCGPSISDLATRASSAPAVSSFSVYALSKGKGVPEQSRQVFQRARALLEDAYRQGRVVRLKQDRIGLEGETRVCAEFSSATVAQELYEQIRQLSEGVELVNVVLEPCPDR
jgi:hypothetical protein